MPNRGNIASKEEKFGGDLGTRPELTPIDTSAREAAGQSLIDEMARQSQGGPNVELQTAAMFGALVQEKDDPALRTLFEDAGEAALIVRGIKSAAAISGFRTALIDYFRQRAVESGEIFSDHELTEARRWKPYIETLKSDLRTQESMAVQALYAGSTFREAATPVASRYYSDELLAQAISERYPNGARGLDVGSSIFGGPLQLIHKAEFPMWFNSVVTTDLGGAVADLTPNANRLLAKKPMFREIVATDVFPVYYEERQSYDIGNLRFSLSGLRPSERNGRPDSSEPPYIQALGALINKKQKNKREYTKDSRVTFQQANLLNPVDLANFKDKYPEPFDVIIGNFVTQELSPHAQREMHKALCGLLAENGILAYNHQARIDPALAGRPVGIEHVQHLSDYAVSEWSSYNHVLDMLNPVRGLQEMMSFYDNRCVDVRLSMGKLVVNGELVPISDLVRNA